MSDLRNAYEEWILNGRQGPRPGAKPAAPDAHVEPATMDDYIAHSDQNAGFSKKKINEMNEADAAEHKADAYEHNPLDAEFSKLPDDIMPAVKPGPQYPEAPGGAGGLGAVWAALKGAAPSVLGYAGAAAAAHLANPPEANQGEEEYLNALLAGQKGTEHVKQTAADAFKGVTADPAPKGSSPITKTELPHELKDSLKKVANMPDDLDSRVQDRDAERERIKGQMQAPQPVKSLDELRLRGREMERERIKQQLLRGE